MNAERNNCTIRDIIPLSLFLKKNIYYLTGGGGWIHPVHVHLVDFFVLKRERNGALPYDVYGPKDGKGKLQIEK